nr:replication small protein [Plumeria mosaic virus]
MAHINDLATISGAPAAAVDKVVSELACKKIYDDTVSTLQSLDRRPKIHFSRALSQDQVALVSKAYPEFNVQFTGTTNSVHNLAGGLRALELEWMMTQIPYGCPTYDIGGNFSAHMLKGRSYVHCCNPMLDIRDIARVQGYHENIQRYICKHSKFAASDTHQQRAGLHRFSRALPEYQIEAFEIYQNNTSLITCNDKFQDCKIPVEDGSYAVALHSIYDIDSHELGPALLRKGVRTMYAAFHMSEEVAMGYSEGTLPEIGASFSRQGEDILFSFHEESTLAYKHKFKNLLAYTTRTFFPASTRYVYFKEFLCSRVCTKFVKFSLVDTFCLNKSVFRHQADIDDELDFCWEKNSLCCSLAEQTPIFTDKALMSVWFPKGSKCVLIPIFDGFFEKSEHISESWELVDKTFVYTVLNHIQTYQAKQLTFQNVLSFCESIRSRVVVNGTSVRSEWDIPLELISKLSLSLFLIAKFNNLKADTVVNSFDFKKRGVFSLMKSKFKEFMQEHTQPLTCWLLNKGFVRSVEDRLEIRDVNLMMTFEDSIRLSLNGDGEVRKVNVSACLEECEKLYILASEITKNFPSVNFDQEKFRQFCDNMKVDVDTVSKVLVGLDYKGISDFTLAGLGYSECRESALAATLCEIPESEKSKRKEKISVVQSRVLGGVLRDSSPPKEHFVINDRLETKKIWREKKTFDMDIAGVSGEKNMSFTLLDDDGVETDLSDMHGKLVKEFPGLHKKKVLAYTGTVKERQMKNAVDYYAATISASLNNLQKLVHDYMPGQTKGFKSYGVCDCASKTWLLTPPTHGHAWGVADTDEGDKVVYLSADKEDQKNLLCPKSWKRVAVSAESMLFSAMKIYQRLLNIEIKEPQCKIILVDGVPGCGKSAEIIERCNLKEDLVLCAGRNAAEMLRGRLNKLGKGATNANVRTIDSFLMNPMPVSFDTVWVDEGLMVHTGIINFIALFAKAKVINVFGDTKQIPFLNRVMDFDYPDELRTLVVDGVEMRSVTKRCPLDVTLQLNEVYKRYVTSSSTVERSLEVKNLIGAAEFEPSRYPEDFDQVIVFTQAEKQTLKKKGYKSVHTVHEVQGETFNKVALVRLDPTQLSIAEKGSPHLLVALSRHTHRLVYYTVKLDALSSLIEKLNNVPSFILQTFRVDSSAK